jgi:hypothetical protein
VLAAGVMVRQPVPVSGKEGVAILLTVVVEMMSTFGVAGLRSLANVNATGTTDAGSVQVAVAQGASPSGTAPSLPRQGQATLPKASLPAVAREEGASARDGGGIEASLE